MNINFEPLRESALGPLIRRLAERIAGSLDSGRSAGVAATGPQAFTAYIADAAQRYDVPEALVRAVIKVESNFKSDAVSSAGAKGLMQLMDGTAKSLGVSDSFDPRQNIDGGVRYLRDLLGRYHDVTLAVAAYNAGPQAVDANKGVPPYEETQAYVRRVLALYGSGQSWEA